MIRPAKVGYRSSVPRLTWPAIKVSCQTEQGARRHVEISVRTGKAGEHEEDIQGARQSRHLTLFRDQHEGRCGRADAIGGRGTRDPAHSR